MKTLLLLLACVAAASAYSYVAPPRNCQYYTRKIACYWVLPAQSCFKYTIYCNRVWFTKKYYAPIMKVYPGESCIEMTEAEFTADCESKLNKRRDEIHADMLAHKNAWIEELHRNAEEWKSAYEQKVRAFTKKFLAYSYCQHYYYQITESMEAKIAAFNSKIDTMVANAVEAYNQAYEKQCQRLYEFHRKMLDAAVKMYRNRLEKIEAFTKALDDRITKYVENARCILTALSEKKLASYKCLLDRVHGGTWWEQIKVSVVVEEYRQKLANEVESAITAYYNHLLSIREDLIRRYSCSYQIITYLGTMNFCKKAYTAHCQNLGTWWTFKYCKAIPIFKFIDHKFLWKKCSYKNLITCDLEKVNKTVEEFAAEIRALGEAAIIKANDRFNSWKLTWSTCIHETIEKYREIVERRHRLLIDAMKAKYYCSYGYWCDSFQCYLVSYEKELTDRKNKAISDYEARLWQLYHEKCVAFQKSIECYARKVNAIVEKVIGAYTDCMAQRDKKIADYTSCMIAKRDEIRRKLDEKLWNIAELKCDHYLEMLKFYHGETVSQCVLDLTLVYKYKILQEYERNLAEFDQYWSELLPKLIHHYSCTYRCSAKATFACPRFCFWPKLKITVPTVRCYAYRLSYYQKYCHYTLKHINGCYYWTA